MALGSHQSDIGAVDGQLSSKVLTNSFFCMRCDDDTLLTIIGHSKH